MSQLPSIGRIVTVPAAAIKGVELNGAEAAPAVITRVWNDRTVNVRVLPDSDAIVWKTSIALYPSRDEYDRAARVNGMDFGCYWPERV